MKYYIGIFSAERKTHLVLVDGIGRVVCSKKKESCYPYDLGTRASAEKLVSAILELAQESPESVSGVFVGIAGYASFGSGFEDYLREKTGINALSAGSYARPLLTGALYRADGCAIICGAGTVCLIRSGERLSRVSGWGYMLGRCGSSYDLGRDAITAVLNEYDGQGEVTTLTDLVSAKMGGHPKDMLAKIYEGKRLYVASFADAVFQGYRIGDSVSRQILRTNIASIADMIKIADRRISGTFTTVLGGGIFRSYPEYTGALRELVPGRIRLMLGNTPMVYGAAVEAVYATENEIPYGFKDNFLATYNT